MLARLTALLVAAQTAVGSLRHLAAVHRRLVGPLLACSAIVWLIWLAPTGGHAPQMPSQAQRTAPPSAVGYFHTRPVGSWSSLPGDRRCARRVHESSWEPRPDNYRPNHTVPPAGRVHRALAARPRSVQGAFARRWDSWLLARVDGQHRGTTDENIQWAACKWGISDNVLRAIAVRESTWYQYEIYPSGRCVTYWGCGDMVTSPTKATRKFCTRESRHGHDYQADYGRGLCPKTFSIAGVMSWQDPAWGRMRGNQNGTFPFNRDSTAFALDFVASDLRGCLEGWEPFLADTGTGTYAAGKLWGCVGAWFSGDWHSPAANRYIHLVRGELADRTWLERSWPDMKPRCQAPFGCPHGP
jgi:hypothetical protein